MFFAVWIVYDIYEHTVINVFTCLICIQGKYCPTTCGVADYLLRYMPGVNKDLDDMQEQLETIANLTQGAEETIVYMKDSTTSAQKSSSPGITFNLVPLNLLHP